MTDDFYVRVYVSFDDWKYIPRDEFEWIEEWHAAPDRKSLVGVIHFSKIKRGSWWKEHNTSLILTPEPIIEDAEIRKHRKKTLELEVIV